MKTYFFIPSNVLKVSALSLQCKSPVRQKLDKKEMMMLATQQVHYHCSLWVVDASNLSKVDCDESLLIVALSFGSVKCFE